MAQRVPDLRAKMRERGLDALLVTHPSNRFYLSGFTAEDTPPNESAGSLLIAGDRSYLITGKTNVGWARAQATGFEVVPREKTVAATVATLLGERGVRRLGYEEDALLVSVYRVLEEETKGEVEFVAVGDLVTDLRLVKSQDELAKIERACAITDAAFAAVWPTMRPDQSEREIAWALELAMRDQGADALAFPIIVAAGVHGASPHHDPTDEPVGEGLPITIDMGARVGGYNADLTRTVVLGEPTPRAREVCATLLRAVEATEAGLRAGMTGHAADALARDVIEAAGYGEYAIHGLGHGVGVRVHEAPSAAQEVEAPLPAGATLTIEPGIYIPDWGGARIEDLVVLEESGVRVLSTAPKQRFE
jgi:Xaa-Pro aminopeptidase